MSPALLIERFHPVWQLLVLSTLLSGLTINSTWSAAWIFIALIALQTPIRWGRRNALIAAVATCAITLIFISLEGYTPAACMRSHACTFNAMRALLVIGSIFLALQFRSCFGAAQVIAIMAELPTKARCHKFTKSLTATLIGASATLPILTNYAEDVRFEIRARSFRRETTIQALAIGVLLTYLSSAFAYAESFTDQWEMRFAFRIDDLLTFRRAYSLWDWIAGFMMLTSFAVFLFPLFTDMQFPAFQR